MGAAKKAAGEKKAKAKAADQPPVPVEARWGRGRWTVLAATAPFVGMWIKNSLPSSLDPASVGATAGGGEEVFAGTSATVWVGTGDDASSAPILSNVSCAMRPLEGSCGAPRMHDRCARFVLDNAIPEEDAREVRQMVEWILEEAWGGGSGPPSVVDLHQGSISYKEKFVELAALMDFKKISFTEAQKAAYGRVREAIRHVVAAQFGVPPDELLHDFTFFSHINASKTAKTVHDEYWHLHTDTEQYGTFEYTTLLYLSTLREDFSGGEFVFEPSAREPDQKPVAVEPRFNRLVGFTSDSENPHRVEKVSKGIRIALTAAFTCNQQKAAEIGPAFPPKRPSQEESEGER